jgi:uncharacterized membrane protein YccF (DUF307 family)
MALIGNLLWLIFGGGIPGFLSWIFSGVILCITVIGIPFGIASFRIAIFVLWPFGQELMDAELLGERRITGTGLANILWIILAGIWLALLHAIVGLLMCITIIGIPFGLANFKIASAAFAPLGKRIVSKEAATAARIRRMNSVQH